MTQQEFSLFFTANYKEVLYTDVKGSFEEFYESQQGHLFHDDYKTISKNDFLDNLLDDAKFQFQDILLEVFYDKNPLVYEQAFTIFEENGGIPSEITRSFDETYKNLYESFLTELFFH